MTHARPRRKPCTKWCRQVAATASDSRRNRLMLALLWLLASYFGPDLDRLGSDSFSVREWELRRCNNLLAVLLLPKTHESPEVRHRMQELRSRHLRVTASSVVVIARPPAPRSGLSRQR